uniref:Uncharacterized protein n=1 Tax=Oryza punctata TaxID=4537 RepID=A0A0E0MDM3_ORYPU
MLRLRNRLLPLLRATSSSHASASSSPLHLRLLLLSTAAATPFSVEDYLVATCGLTGAQALKASKKVSHLRSPSNPDAVLALLSGVGLSGADLAAVVVAEPQLLCARADNIARRIASLRDRVGLSEPQIGGLLLAGGATVVHRCDVTPRLEFWIPFLGSFEMLLKILKSNNSILRSSLERVIKPNIALFQKCGLSVCDIVTMAQTAAWTLTFNPERLKVVLERAEKLCVPGHSSAFKYVVCTVARIDEGKIAARMELLSSTLGCSMDELRSAICKSPQVLGISEMKLRAKIEFLVTKVGLEIDYILRRPVLLALSLEKRLVPRHYVVEALAVKGLIRKDLDFFSCVCMRDEVFVAKYIDHHENALPGLADAYAAVRAGKLPAQV